MKFELFFRKFCNEHGYLGNIGYDENQKEYRIVISKGDDNAGLFMTKKELKSLSDKQLEEFLEMLHKGFEEKFGG